MSESRRESDGADGDREGKENAPEGDKAPLPPPPEILRGTNPHVILRRLLRHDPFGLETRARRWMREQAYLLSPERLGLRAMARVAFQALAYRGSPELEPWLAMCIQMAGEDLLAEQREEEEQGVAVERSDDAEFYTEFGRITGVPAQWSRLVCLVLNTMSSEERRTFFAVVIEGKSVARWVAEGHGPPAKVEEMLRSIGLRVLGALELARRMEGGKPDDG